MITIAREPNQRSGFTLLALVAALALALAVAPNALAAPIPVLSPTSLDFQAQVGTQSAPQSVTLTNTGDDSLVITGKSVSGPFEVGNQCDAPRVLLEDEMCTVEVRFNPSATGPATGSLTFDFLTVADKAVALTGTGTAQPPPDGDGDGVPNAQDQCPTVAGVVPSGCPASPPGQPDGDRDGVVGTLDRCPTQRGIPADGCPDRDDDGISDRVDRCISAPGDLANGCPRELNADIRGVWRVNRLLSKMLTLHVRVPVGSRIDVRCQGKRNVCPFSTRAIKKTRRGTTSLTRYFKRPRVFPAGTIIVVRATRRDRLGTYEKLVTRSGRRLPAVKRRCIDHRGKAIRCP